MRILHLINRFDFCDGCARHVFFQIRAQREKGHTVCLVTPVGDALPLLEGLDVRVHVVPLLAHERRTPVNFIRGLAVLFNICRDFKPNLVHAHHYYHANMAMLLRRVQSWKLVTTVHADFPQLGPLPQHVGDRVIAVSRSIYGKIARSSNAKDRLVLVENGSDFLNIAASAKEEVLLSELMGKRNGKRLVGFFGRLVTEKGVHVFLRALSRVKTEGVVGLFVGTGPEEEKLRRDAEKDDIPAYFVGCVQNIKPFLDACDIVVIPSLKWEGLPMVLLEAAQRARPVIASKTDGIPELVENDVTGVLVSPGSVQELVTAIQYLLSSPSVAGNMGAQLKNRLWPRYSVERMTSETLRIYRELVES